jgi:hypothetical protein
VAGKKKLMIHNAVDAAQAVAADTTVAVVEATAPVVSVVSDAAVSFGSSVAVAGNAVASATANAATNAAVLVSDASDATVTYVSSIDPIKILNNSEKIVTDTKVASIKTVFNTKRMLVKKTQKAAKSKHDLINHLVGVASTNLDSAIAETNVAFAAATNAAAAMAAEINLPNAEIAFGTAVNTTVTALQETGIIVLDSLNLSKDLIRDAATNFDSRKVVRAKHDAIGAAFDYTVESVEMMGEQAGIFKVIDSVVHGTFSSAEYLLFFTVFRNDKKSEKKVSLSHLVKRHFFSLFVLFFTVSQLFTIFFYFFFTVFLSKKVVLKNKILCFLKRLF